MLDFKRLPQFYIHQVFLMCVCVMAVYDFFFNWVLTGNLMIPMVKSCPPDHWQLSLAPLLTRFCSIAFNVRTNFVIIFWLSLTTSCLSQCLQTNWSSIIQQLAQCVNEWVVYSRRCQYSTPLTVKGFIHLANFHSRIVMQNLYIFWG